MLIGVSNILVEMWYYVRITNVANWYSSESTNPLSKKNLVGLHPAQVGDVPIIWNPDAPKHWYPETLISHSGRIDSFQVSDYIFIGAYLLAYMSDEIP